MVTVKAIGCESQRFCTIELLTGSLHAVNGGLSSWTRSLPSGNKFDKCDNVICTDASRQVQTAHCPDLKDIGHWLWIGTKNGCHAQQSVI